LNGIQEVGGSTPPGSTTPPDRLNAASGGIFVEIARIHRIGARTGYER
jgi:hypothetical protein